MAEDGRGKEFEVTAEEALFLRRFVRHELLPWVAGVAALAGLALAAALMATPSGAPSAPQASARKLPETSGLSAGALAELRAESARLRADLTALASALEAARGVPVGDADASSRQAEEGARLLEARLREAFDARVSRLETMLASRASGESREVAADTTPAAPGDLGAIRERLYNLEMRQDRKDQERAALQQDVLSRLYDLERASQSEAAARLENLQSGEQRTEKLELRLNQLEHRWGAGSAPAAPATSE